MKKKRFLFHCYCISIANSLAFISKSTVKTVHLPRSNLSRFISMTPRATATITSAQDGPLHDHKHVAIIGSGAAGLVASRILRDAGMQVQVYEKSDDIGGVWKYRPDDVMYQSLVTNLPKEIMSYLDFPFDPSLPSFLGHAQVQSYLGSYASKHSLRHLIEFNTEVLSVRPILSTRDKTEHPNGEIATEDYSIYSEGEGEVLPLWEIEVLSASKRERTKQIFDAVVVCNGHFDRPYTPHLPGLVDCYKGQVLHSRHYDKPQQELFQGKKILCVGYKSSGTDIAREVSAVAREVYVVDRRLKGEGQGEKVREGNIYRRPGIQGFRPDGHSVEFEDGSICEDLDVVLFCTGYCYHLPFLAGGQEQEEEQGEGGGRMLRVEDRAMYPLYQHLFHAYWPNLAFMGLLHSVVPFPMFDLQAHWIKQVFLGAAKPLPDRQNRFQWVEEEKERQRAVGRKGRDWFYMGPQQWDYFRLIAKETALLDDDLENELAIREAIYDDVSERRPTFPGGIDTYRRCQYRVVDKALRKWEVLLPPEESE